MNYVSYNREERNLCSHLFRLLHLEEKNYSFLRQFLSNKSFNHFEIFSEVALIRDTYYYHKQNNIQNFIDNIINVIIGQENVNSCRIYSELNSELNNPLKTHPRQIRQKAKELGYLLNENEIQVYGCLQAYFNAKPDLAIFLDDEIIVYEAKLMMPFDEFQIQRTNKIVEIWSKLLYEDLGYQSSPLYSLRKIGLKKYNPDISWEEIKSIASDLLKDNDKSLVTLNNVLDYCKVKV